MEKLGRKEDDGTTTIDRNRGEREREQWKREEREFSFHFFFMHAPQGKPLNKYKNLFSLLIRNPNSLIKLFLFFLLFFFLFQKFLKIKSLLPKITSKYTTIFPIFLKFGILTPQSPSLQIESHK